MRKSSSVVQVNPDLCTWEVDIASMGRNAPVRPPMGCRLVYIHNGQAETIPVGEQIFVNSHQVLKNQDEEAVVCVNIDKVFTILWGIGEINYFDKEFDLETQIGMCGEFRIKMHPLQSHKLILTLGKRNVGVNDIKDYLSSKLKQVLCSTISQMLATESFEKLQGLQSGVAWAIEQEYKTQLENMGVVFVENSFSLQTIRFDDEYLQARKEKKESGAVPQKPESASQRITRERREKAEALRQQEAEKKQMEEIKSVIGEPTTTCPNCGWRVSSDDVFCPKCGKSLKV